MREVNILSIDWDYFMRTSYSSRRDKFPKEISEDCLEEDGKLDKLWKEMYLKFPELCDIQVLPSFHPSLVDLLRQCLKSESPRVMIAESHAKIYDFICKNIRPSVHLRLVYMDFEHYGPAKEALMQEFGFDVDKAFTPDFRGGNNLICNQFEDYQNSELVEPGPEFRLGHDRGGSVSKLKFLFGAFLERECRTDDSDERQEDVIEEAGEVPEETRVGG